jgi:hypothetical protein
LKARCKVIDLFEFAAFTFPLLFQTVLRTKVLLPQAQVTLADFWLSCLIRPFGFIAPKTLNYLALVCFDFECTWWSLFQKRAVRTKFDINFFIKTTNCKIITFTRKIHISLMINSKESFEKIHWSDSFNVFSHTQFIKSTIVFPLLNKLAFQYFDIERTWWRLFQKRVVRTELDVYVFITEHIWIDNRQYLLVLTHLQ